MLKMPPHDTAQRSRMMLTETPHNPRGQTGVGLIEILVAIVILAIGFLAAGKMQLAGMRYSQSAYFDSQAYFMAGEMIARMRANLEGIRTDEYIDLTTAAGLGNPGCTLKMCTPAELADQDIYDWSQHLYGPSDSSGFTALLPSSDTVAAQGTVRQLASGAFSVTLIWADEADEENGERTLRVDLFMEN